MLPRLQGHHPPKRNDVPTHSSAQSSKKSGGEGHPNFQGSFYCHPMRSQKVLHFEFVGQFTATGRTYTQHASAITDDTNYVSIRLPVEATRLQCQPICTPWVQSQGASCPIKLRNVGATHSQWFLHWQCMGSLPLPRDLHQ
jgi:hypothetical protein